MGNRWNIPAPVVNITTDVYEFSLLVFFIYFKKFIDRQAHYTANIIDAHVKTQLATVDVKFDL